MNFNDKLNEYIKIIGCTSKELADISNISPSLISKYRNRNRTINNNSNQLNKLIDGLYFLSKKYNIKLNKEEIIIEFNKLNNNTELLVENFNKLITILNISIVDLSRYLNYDASHLSRIKNGKRKPSDPKMFSQSVSNYILKKYNSEDNINSLKKLFNSNKITNEVISNWLNTNKKMETNYISDFLNKMDEFNLNEYINVIHFDELKVPSIPFQLPTQKNYYGIEQMKIGELNFFKSTILSKNIEPIFMCSDMPMEDMTKDLNFSKKWMYAIALSLKKGHHINIIHNLNRPFSEMMLGLESWIPIYMTGQISPYYLNHKDSDVYNHLNYVSGNAALTGECIKNHHDNGKYYLTNNKDEVLYYKKKSEDLINKSKPLMQILNKDDINSFKAIIDKEMNIIGKRHNILSNLPIYTIEEHLLIEILKNNKINKKDCDLIINYYKNQVNYFNNILKHSIIEDEINDIQKNDKIKLSLSCMFYDKDIYYTYEQYKKHLENTKKLSNELDNYSIKINNNAFKNIQIYCRDNKWVMISKENNPTIHFVINHPKLCDAIEKFVVPIKE